MDSKEHSAPSFDTWSTTAPEPQWNLQMSTPTLKQESVQCVDEEETCIDIMYPSVALQSSEYVNYYDYKDHVLEQMKKESIEDELGQSVSSLNTKIVFDNKELSKFIDGLEVKHKNTEEATSLNIKKEDKDIDYQFVIKTETLQQQGVVDNAGDTSVNCEQKTLNDSSDLLRLINESVKVEINTPGYDETNGLHQCQYCDAHFDNHDNILIHISLVHNEGTPKCEICGRRFTSLSNLKRHILALHKSEKISKKVYGNSWKCKYCNKDFIHKYILNDHMKVCHPGKEDEEMNYKCDTCEGVYKSKKSLKMHKKRMHNDSKRKYLCWCGKQFYTPKNLNQHKRLRHDFEINNDKYKCNMCQKLFKAKYSLLRHVQKNHYDYGKSFKCWCGKQFRSSLHLHDHKLQHDRKNKYQNNEKFQCDSCQKHFKSRQNLIIHIKRNHYDYGRWFECWCGKKCRSPIHLNEHSKVHNRKNIIPNNEKFQCDSCQKHFKSRQSLVIHIKRNHYDYAT